MADEIKDELNNLINSINDISVDINNEAKQYRTIIEQLMGSILFIKLLQSSS